MNRLMILAVAATLGGVGELTHELLADPPVNLQSSSPGVQQTGHINVSGTVLAGTFYGSSSGTTTKVVSGWATSPTGFVFGGDFRSASTDGRGVFGSATSSTGFTYGGDFRSASVNGRGIFGYATAATGQGIGGEFRADSPNGVGVMAKAKGLGTALRAESPLGLAGEFLGQVKATANGSSGAIWGETNTQYGEGVLGTNSNASNGVGVSGQATSLTGSTYGVSGGSNSNGGVGVQGYAGSAAGATYGLYGYAVSVDGTGVYGFGGGIGGFFETNSSTGTELTARASANSGTTIGAYVLNYSTSGSAVYGRATATTGTTYGGRFENASSSGKSVSGEASATTGTAIGGYFKTASSSGYGVMGLATADNGINGGGFFQTFSTNGDGVFGYAYAGSGNTTGGSFRNDSTDGKGVFGSATATSGVNYGVYGTVSSAAGFGVYSNGNMGASGLKPFRIDHPLDPQNRYLYHYSAEGPDPLNVYSGNVTTDAQGVAWIQLPDYFEEINKDFRYTLTVIDEGDAFVQAKVWRRIIQNRFAIRTSQPHTDVSWEVKAVRNDLWVRAHGAPVEVAKEGREKGTYQHPELYGKPIEEGLDFRPSDRGSHRNSKPSMDFRK